MRVVLFDWADGGHHPVYLRRFAEALGSSVEVAVAAPDRTLAELAGVGARLIPIGPARPAIDASERLGRTRHVARAELELMERAARQAAAAHVLHLYADAVLPRLATSRSRGLRVTTLLFYPRAHYPDAFGVRLPAAERLRAAAKEIAVAAWRRRPDAHAVMTLDEEAARRWSARGGAPAYWVPEPAVDGGPGVAAATRSGCILYGALAERKGIDLLARAVAAGAPPLRVMLAGEPDPGFLPRLEGLVAEMRRAGASVEVRPRRLPEEEGLRALASARCAVLPYPRHDGMSRVLLEACSVGTPVIVHDYGLLAHLVRRHELGIVVDCHDSRALCGALLELTSDAGTTERYAAALRSFAARHSREAFAEAVARPFTGDAGAAASGGVPARPRLRTPQA